MLSRGERKLQQSLKRDNKLRQSRLRLNVVDPLARDAAWFLGDVDHRRTLLALQGKKEGAFIVRNSQSVPGSFVLSFVNKSKNVCNVVIKRESRGVKLQKSKVAFPFISDLIGFYSNRMNRSVATLPCLLDPGAITKQDKKKALDADRSLLASVTSTLESKHTAEDGNAPQKGLQHQRQKLLSDSSPVVKGTTPYSGMEVVINDDDAGDDGQQNKQAFVFSPAHTHPQDGHFFGDKHDLNSTAQHQAAPSDMTSRKAYASSMKPQPLAGTRAISGSVTSSLAGNYRGSHTGIAMRNPNYLTNPSMGRVLLAFDVLVKPSRKNKRRWPASVRAMQHMASAEGYMLDEEKEVLGEAHYRYSSALMVPSLPHDHWMAENIQNWVFDDPLEEWSARDVQEWLFSIGCHDAKAPFEEHSVDGARFAPMTAQDIAELGVNEDLSHEIYNHKETLLLSEKKARKLSESHEEDVISGSGMRNLQAVPTAPVEQWDKFAVRAWLLYGPGYDAQLAEIFVRAGIDGRSLLQLTDSDLQALGISSETDRKDILASIEELRQHNAARARRQSIVVVRRGDNMYLWSVDEVASFLTEHGFGPHVPAFKRAHVSGRALAAMRHGDLVGLGMTHVGERERLLTLVEIEKRKGSDPDASEAGNTSIYANRTYRRPDLLARWTVDDVCAWLEELGFVAAVPVFRKHAVTGVHLLTIEKSDVASMSLEDSLVDAVFDAIVTLRNSCADQLTTQTSAFEFQQAGNVSSRTRAGVSLAGTDMLSGDRDASGRYRGNNSGSGSRVFSEAEDVLVSADVATGDAQMSSRTSDADRLEKVATPHLMFVPALSRVDIMERVETPAIEQETKSAIPTTPPSSSTSASKALAPSTRAAVLGEPNHVFMAKMKKHLRRHGTLRQRRVSSNRSGGYQSLRRAYSRSLSIRTPDPHFNNLLKNRMSSHFGINGNGPISWDVDRVYREFLPLSKTAAATMREMGINGVELLLAIPENLVEALGIENEEEENLVFTRIIHLQEENPCPLAARWSMEDVLYWADFNDMSLLRPVIQARNITGLTVVLLHQAQMDALDVPPSLRHNFLHAAGRQQRRFHWRDKEHPMTWCPAEVCDYLRSTGFENLVPLFRHKVNGEQLLHSTPTSLERLGVVDPLEQVSLLNQIATLSHEHPSYLNTTTVHPLRLVIDVHRWDVKEVCDWAAYTGYGNIAPTLVEWTVKGPTLINLSTSSDELAGLSPSERDAFVTAVDLACARSSISLIDMVIPGVWMWTPEDVQQWLVDIGHPGALHSDVEGYDIMTATVEELMNTFGVRSRDEATAIHHIIRDELDEHACPLMYGVATWTPAQVQAFFARHGLAEVRDVINEHQVYGDQMLNISEDDLADMGVPASTQARMFEAIDSLRQTLLDARMLNASPHEWTSEHVAQWFTRNGFGQYAELIVSLGLGGTIMLQISDRELEFIGLENVDDQQQFRRAISALRAMKGRLNVISAAEHHEDYSTHPVLQWTEDDVCGFLSKRRLAMFEHQFRRHGINGHGILFFSPMTLDAMGISNVKHRALILAAIHSARHNPPKQAAVSPSKGGSRSTADDPRKSSLPKATRLLSASKGSSPATTATTTPSTALPASKGTAEGAWDKRYDATADPERLLAGKPDGSFLVTKGLRDDELTLWVVDGKHIDRYVIAIVDASQSGNGDDADDADDDVFTSPRFILQADDAVEATSYASLSRLIAHYRTRHGPLSTTLQLSSDDEEDIKRPVRRRNSSSSEPMWAWWQVDTTPAEAEAVLMAQGMRTGAFVISREVPYSHSFLLSYKIGNRIEREAIHHTAGNGESDEEGTTGAPVQTSDRGAFALTRLPQRQHDTLQDLVHYYSQPTTELKCPLRESTAPRETAFPVFASQLASQVTNSYWSFFQVNEALDSAEFLMGKGNGSFVIKPSTHGSFTLDYLVGERILSEKVDKVLSHGRFLGFHLQSAPHCVFKSILDLLLYHEFTKHTLQSTLNLAQMVVLKKHHLINEEEDLKHGSKPFAWFQIGVPEEVACRELLENEAGAFVVFGSFPTAASSALPAVSLTLAYVTHHGDIAKLPIILSNRTASSACFIDIPAAEGSPAPHADEQRIDGRDLEDLVFKLIRGNFLPVKLLKPTVDGKLIKDRVIFRRNSTAVTMRPKRDWNWNQLDKEVDEAVKEIATAPQGAFVVSKSGKHNVLILSYVHGGKIEQERILKVDSRMRDIRNGYALERAQQDVHSTVEALIAALQQPSLLECPLQKISLFNSPIGRKSIHHPSIRAPNSAARSPHHSSSSNRSSLNVSTASALAIDSSAVFRNSLHLELPE